MTLVFQQVMFSAVSTVIFKSAVGLLVNKDTNAEQANLQENDVADHEFRNFIVSKLNHAELEMAERKDLRESIGHFSKGVLHFFTLFDTEERRVVESDEDSSLPVSERSVKMPCVEGKTPLSSTSPAKRLKNLKLTESDESKRALLDAKVEFKKAYLIATEAFNNEDLCLFDRIQAMAIRVAATALEKIEYPEDALAPCMLYLEELHSMPDVQNTFASGFMFHKIVAKRGKTPMDSLSRRLAAQRRTRKDLSSGKDLLSLPNPLKKVEYRLTFSRVCHVNRVLYDIVQTLGRANLLMTWPCVNTKRRRAFGVGEKVDPLRDSRVANVLRELRMEHCCVTPWSFGQEDEEENRLKDPRGIVTSTEGEFIIADRGDHNVKVFDRGGKFEYSFCPLPVNELTNIDVRDVAIDSNDCLYVLVRVRDPAGAKENRVCMFEKSGKRPLLMKGFLLRKGFSGRSLTVNDNKNVLVTDSRQTIDVYEPNGQLIRSIGVGTPKPNVFAIAAANDGCVMVLNKHDSDIQVFGEQGDLINNFNVEGSYHTHDQYPRIVFHPASEHLIVAGFKKKKFRVDMLIYTESGEFVRRIQYGEEKISSIQDITVTPEGRFAAIVLQLDSERRAHSKVLIV